jgi:TRAP-type C4-dicarboxylate transport system permease small subunit
MDKLLRGIEALSKGGAYLSALSMLLIVGLILVEIIARAVFGVSTMIAAEYSGYMLVALVLLGFAYTIEQGGFIRINLVRTRMSDETKRRMDIFAAAFSAAITGYIFYFSVFMVYETWALGMEADTVAETPLWIPQVMVPVGLLMLLIQLLGLIARRVRQS